MLPQEIHNIVLWQLAVAFNFKRKERRFDMYIFLYFCTPK